MGTEFLFGVMTKICGDGCTTLWMPMPCTLKIVKMATYKYFTTVKKKSIWKIWRYASRLIFLFLFFSVLRIKALTDFRVCYGLEGNFSVEFSLQHTLSKYSLNGWWIYGAGIDMNDLCRETESFQYVKKNYLNNAGWCIKESLKKSL